MTNTAQPTTKTPKVELYCPTCDDGSENFQSPQNYFERDFIVCGHCEYPVSVYVNGRHLGDPRRSTVVGIEGCTPGELAAALQEKK